MYTITLKYQTGNSFRSYETETTLEASWLLDVAKENLKRIKAHYTAYSNRNGYVSCMMGKKENELLKTIKSEPWYVSQPEYSYGGYDSSWESNVMLMENDGSSKEYYCNWCGYFEHLHGGRIVAVVGEDSDMEFDV